MINTGQDVTHGGTVLLSTIIRGTGVPDLRRRFESYVRVPLPRWENRHFVQELIDSCQQVFPVTGLVRHVVEHLSMNDVFCNFIAC